MQPDLGIGEIVYWLALGLLTISAGLYLAVRRRRYADRLRGVLLRLPVPPVDEVLESERGPHLAVVFVAVLLCLIGGSALTVLALRLVGAG